MQIAHHTRFISVFTALAVFMLVAGIRQASGSTGTEVFRGFTRHISDQIVRDKQDFYVAQTCTTFFYKKSNPAKPPQIEKILSMPTAGPSTDFDCPNRYPRGLDEAREAFSQSQHTLSLSLTFFQFALVSDGDDDEQYAGEELRDLMESFGVTFEDHLPSARYITSLNRLFDSVMNTGEIETLTNSMSILFRKGYRFTPADQAALNRELN